MNFGAGILILMRKRRLVGSIVVLSSLVGWLVCRAVIVPPSKTVTLEWDYPEWTPEIIFNVYHSDSLKIPVSQWPLLVSVTNTSCVVPAPTTSHFYTVTASNQVTGLESQRTE